MRPEHVKMSDPYFMQTALNLALQGKGRTSPNPLVGAVIVKGRRIIAEGWHQRCGGDHAEIIALKKAGDRARGARLYITLEPCFHYGRTPPCVEQIIRQGISEVIMAMKDPNPLTNGKSIARLRRAGIGTRVGILQEEALAMNEAFVKYITAKMPFVVAKCAQTLDGKIATAAGHSQWITSLQARAYAHRLRDEFDAIAVGIHTVIQDNPRLNGDDPSRRLKKIVLDPSLRISPEARLFQNVDFADCFLAVGANAPSRKMKSFQGRGVNVLVCPQRDGWLDWKWLLKELAKREIVSILIEGGAQTIGHALQQDAIDKFYIYVAPKIMGDQNALSAVDGTNTVDVNKAVHLSDLTIQRIGEDILMTGYV